MSQASNIVTTRFVGIDLEREQAWIERKRASMEFDPLAKQLERARERGFKKTLVDLDVLTSLLSKVALSYKQPTKEEGRS